jgi:hypothetical protein
VDFLSEGKWISVEGEGHPAARLRFLSWILLETGRTVPGTAKIIIR